MFFLNLRILAWPKLIIVDMKYWSELRKMFLELWLVFNELNSSFKHVAFLDSPLLLNNSKRKSYWIGYNNYENFVNLDFYICFCSIPSYNIFFFNAVVIIWLGESHQLKNHDENKKLHLLNEPQAQKRQTMARKLFCPRTITRK